MLKKILAKIYGFGLNILSLFSKKMAGKKAFYIFCTVRKGKVLPHQSAYLDAAKNEIHSIAGHRIQSYKWPGKKETILLVHGWESNAFRWQRLIEKLKESDFNIIAFDAPAHGNSTGKILHLPLYDQIIQLLITTYEPSYIMGHSMGGMAVMYNQYLHKNTTLKKTITIAAPSEFEIIIKHYKNLLALNTRVITAMKDYISANYNYTTKEYSTAAFAKSNTSLGLLLHDKLDTITPYHCSEKVHVNWAGSSFISTKGLGHSMHQDQVNDQIIAFLKS